MAARVTIGSAAVHGHTLWQRVRDRAFTLAIAGSFEHLGRGSVLQVPLKLGRPHRISIGSGVFIGLGSWLQVLEGHGTDDPRIEIGDNTSITGFCVLTACASIRLGRSVLLARNVFIADHGHEFHRIGVPVRDQGVRDVQPVEICDGAWLGQNVVVMPGVRIGVGAVVGANSVVLADVPDYAVAVGAPARVVRRHDGTDWHRTNAM